MYTVIDVKYGYKDIDTDIEGDNLQTAWRRYASAVACFGPDPDLDKSKMSPTEHHLSLAKECQKNDAVLRVKNDADLIFFIIVDLKRLHECFTTPHTIELSENKQGETLLVIDYQELEMCFPHALSIQGAYDNLITRHLPKHGNVKPIHLHIDLLDMPSPQQAAYQGALFAGAVYEPTQSFTSGDSYTSANSAIPPFPSDIDQSYIEGSSSQTALYSTGLSQELSLQSSAYTYPAMLSNFPPCVYTAEGSRNPHASIPPQPPISGSSFYLPASGWHGEPSGVDSSAITAITASTGQASMAPATQGSSGGRQLRKKRRYGRRHSLSDPDSITPKCMVCDGPAKRQELTKSFNDKSSVFSFKCKNKKCATSFLADLSKFISERSEAEINEDIDSDKKQVSVTCRCGLKALIEELKPIGVGTIKAPTQKYRCKDPTCSYEITDPENRKAKRYLVEPDSKFFVEDPDSVYPSCKDCHKETRRRGYKPMYRGRDTVFTFSCKDSSCGLKFTADMAKFIRERSEEEINKDIDPDSDKDSFTCECHLTVSVKDLQPFGVGTDQHPIQKYKCNNPNCNATIEDPRNRKAKLYLDESNQPRSKVARLEDSEFNSDESFCRYCGKKESILKSQRRGNTMHRTFGCRLCQLKVPLQKVGDNDFLRPTCPECGPKAKISTIRMKQTKAGKPLFQCTHCNKLIVFKNL